MIYSQIVLFNDFSISVLKTGSYTVSIRSHLSSIKRKPLTSCSPQTPRLANSETTALSVVVLGYWISLLSSARRTLLTNISVGSCSKTGTWLSGTCSTISCSTVYSNICAATPEARTCSTSTNERQSSKSHTPSYAHPLWPLYPKGECR